MSTPSIRDWLTKQLLQHNIVTYRSLSRQFDLNVHVAHNELATFLETNGQNAAATYLVSGESKPIAYRVGDDGGAGGHADIEATQASLQSVESVLVYSISPSLPRDAGLLCTPTTDLRAVDAKKDPTFGAVVGRIVGANVIKSDKARSEWKSSTPVAGPSKPTAAKEEKLKEKEKPKPTGKLDFSKMKVKKEEETAKSTVKSQAKTDESKTRGTKRKSALAISDSEGEEESVKVVEKPKPKPKAAPAPAGSSVRVRKNVILSDDEDEDVLAPDRKGKGKTVVKSQEEKDLHALMDIDDDEVQRASRSATPAPKDEPDEDVEMMDAEEKSAPAPRQRKPKKVVPVGRNGLKKKRILKSRSKLDAKGYMVTEDYSEYESVEEEEEPAPKTKARPKAKEKETSEVPSKAIAKPSQTTKPKPKPGGGSGSLGPQKSIASFFGKGK
ncbi:DNA polymerase subunit Cdc27 [Mycena kentingensis (nom. inval.)]|nr:DNA polymerase subunit Cdc27 [Mycena kentingensis (nom. inval.)]